MKFLCKTALCVLQRRDALTKVCICEGLKEIRREMRKTTQSNCPKKIKPNRIPRIVNIDGRARQTSQSYSPNYYYDYYDYYDYNYDNDYYYYYDVNVNVF